MKRLFYALLLVALTATIQIRAESFKVSGIVIAEDDTPVEFANVVLQTGNSEEIAGTASNPNGRFEIKVSPGRYTLSISYIGYETYTSEIIADKDTDLGIIRLKPDTRLLREVTVYAPRKLFERKADRLIFNVENSIISTGGDVTDAFRVIPGLRVQNDQISMIAKSNMIVTVNDRVIPLTGESLINYLKSIPTASIKNIEIITNPPAKYDAEGNSGIVNIVLKKAVSDSWNLDLRGAYKQQTYSEGNGGIDFNYKKDRLSVFTNVNAGGGKDLYQMKNLIYYPTETWILTAPLYRTYKSFGTNAGIDYKLTETWKIGAVYFAHWTYNPHRIDNINTTVYNADNNAVEKIMPSSKKNDRSGKLNAVNLNSIIALDTLGKKISVDLDYFYNNSCDSFDNSGNSYYPNMSVIPDSYYANINRNKSKVTNYSAKVDVELPMRWINLNLGGKLSFTDNNNDYIFYDYTTGSLITDNNQTNIFRYKENIQAGYLSANKQITKQFQVQAGLRMENTVTEGYSKTLNQTDRNNYLKLFPTCYLLYKTDDNRSIALNYSRRIDRPPFYALNPYKTYFNAYDYNEGNPFLKPSFSHNLELSLTSPRFEHKLWYSSVSGDIYRFPFVDTLTQIVRHYPVNCINYYSTGLSESYTFNKIWWWNSYNNGVCYYIRKTAALSEALPSIQKISANFSTNNDFMLNKKRTIVLNVGFYYEFPYLDDYDNSEAYYYLYGGIKARFLKDNLTVALTVNDLFKTNYSKSTVVSNDIKYVYDSRPDSRYLRLSISYKIGNKNIRTERRNAGNEDERGRVN